MTNLRNEVERSLTDKPKGRRQLAQGYLDALTALQDALLLKVKASVTLRKRLGYEGGAVDDATLLTVAHALAEEDES